MEMIACRKCNRNMPRLRLDRYGFDHCVNCSTIQKVGGIPITNHKTGNTIQIVPMEVAVKVARMAARHGYGVSAGVRARS